MKVYLIGKTISSLFQREEGEWTLPGKAKGSRFEDKVYLDGASDGQTLIEFAGRLCYESFDLPNDATAENGPYIRNIVNQGHESVLEHASVTFYIEGVSRNLTHELIRHRHLSFSELSQRYVDMSDANFVIPPAYRELEDWPDSIPLPDEYQKKYEHNVQVLLDNGYTRKQAREAARASLPSGVETKIVVSGNLRAWRDVLKKRWTKYADAEMQLLAGKLYHILDAEYPDVFEDIEYGG